LRSELNVPSLYYVVVSGNGEGFTAIVLGVHYPV